VTTGDAVFRQGPLPGAVLSGWRDHIRVGPSSISRAWGTRNALRGVSTRSRGTTRRRQRPRLRRSPSSGVVARQAELIARGCMSASSWCDEHDNCAVLGETIDFGPLPSCAYEPGKVFSSTTVRA